MKKILATAFFLSSLASAWAQSGLHCYEAIPLPAGTGKATNAVLTGPEMWFTFTAGEVSEEFSIQTAKPGKDPARMEIYSGECGRLVKMEERKFRAASTIFSTKKRKLNKGAVYYLKISREQASEPLNIQLSQRSSGGGGGNHSAFLCANGTVKCAGSNTNGQLGNGTTGGSSSTPVSVSGLTNVTAVAAGAGHTLALISGGTIESWGTNTYGELGDNTTTDSDVPVSVSGLSNVVQVSAGDNFSLALKSDGTVWAWGSNQFGQLGDGTYTDQYVPVQITGLSNITDIEAGAWHAMALKNDGTVWVWGDNQYGQLGDGTTNGTGSPIQVAGSYTTTALSAGDDFSVLVTTSGVYATGDNTLGQLGDGTTTASLSYVASSSVNAITGSWLQISCGTEHTLALRNDLTVWAWGQNWFGQLGNGTSSPTAYLSVVQASGLSCVYEISAGWQFSIASTMDGTVYTWGNNFIGQLGDGTTTDRHSPTANGTCDRLDPITFSGTASICIGGSTNLTASGGTGSYSWSPATGLNVTTGSVVTASPTVTTTYTVTDPSGCIPTPVTVTVNPLPTISISPASPVTCAGYPITLTASGATTYTWNTGPTTATVSVSPTIATSYTVTGTDANGCVNTASTTVNINSPGPCCVPPSLVLTGSTITSTALGALASGSVVVLPASFNLVIDNSPTYTNVVFRFGTQAKITVNALTASSGVNTLTLDNCQLYNDCGANMWKGIFLIHSGSDYGNITLRNGTSMEDAEDGIVATGNTATGNNTNVGGVIDISNCVLNKNYFHVQISNYTNTSTPYPLSIKTSTLSCVASANSPGVTLNAPLSGSRTYAGFYLNNVTNCVIGKTTAAGDLNYFSDMDYGVHATTSGAEVVNNNFSSMAGNTVSSVPYGICVYAPNTSTTSKTIVVGGSSTYAPNTISNVYRGVDATYCGEVDVLNNQMSCTTTPASFAVSGNLTSQFGVRVLNTATKVDIESNTITNFANAIGVRRNVNTSTSFNPNTIIETNTIGISGSGYVSIGIGVVDAVGNLITTSGPVLVRDNTLSNIRDNGILCQNLINHPVVAGTSAGSQSIGMLFSGSAVSKGILMQGSDRANISNNSISSTSNANTNMVGIYLSTAKSSWVSCNSISTIGICIRAEGQSVSPYTAASSFTCGIVSNTFNNALGGISLVNSGNIGKQGNLSHPAGNVWQGTAASYTSGQLLTDGASTPDGYFYGTGTGENPSTNLVAWSAALVVASTSGSSFACPGPSSRYAANAIQEETTSAVKVYPNPTEGSFTISTDTPLDFVRIEVFNALGKKLASYESVKFSSGQVDLAGLGAGVYYVHITGSGINETRKVVKE